MNKNLNRISFLFLFLIAAAFSIKGLREPDIWWQTRTGEWILQNHAVPVKDVFSYTMNGTPWLNVKWGSEVLFAIVTKLSGPECIFLIQAFVSILLLFFLIKLSKLVHADDIDKNISAFALTISTLLTFICIEYRMIGRPEMFSHLFSVIFIYLLLYFRSNNKNQIYLLIPLQLLWANMHEAFGTGIVITAIFVFTQWFEYFADKAGRSKEKINKSLKLSAIFLASIAAVSLNPNGIQLLIRPLNILSQVYENKYTTELLSFTEHAFWSKEAYITLIIFCACLIYFLKSLFIKSIKKKIRFFEKIDLSYLFILIAFFYLASTANRNIAFLSLVLFPLLYRMLCDVFKRLQRFKSFYKIMPAASLILVFIFYSLIVSGAYYKITDSRDQFGMQVLATHNPLGAAEFIEQNGLKNKKCFSDYLTSSYLLWKLKPEFKTFIDLRDLDIFPPEFIDKFIDAANYPPLFFSLDSVYHFDYVVLFNPQFTELHKYLYNDSLYALKYADAVAAIYEKTDHFSRDDIFSKLKTVKSSVTASVINKILNPFYKPDNKPLASLNEIAAIYYNSVLRFDLARARAQSCLNNKEEKYKGYYLLGQISFDMSQREKDQERKNQLLSESENFFFESINLNKNYARALAGMGNIQLQKNDYVSALKYFERSLDQDKTVSSVHLMAAETCKALSDKNPNSPYVNSTIEHYQSALDYLPNNQYIETELGLAYWRAGDCKNAVTHLEKVTGSNRITVQQQQAITKCLQECGLINYY